MPDDSKVSGSRLRERILEAAMRLFAERGYGSTSVRQVVEAVGCTKPALYYHFGSKEDLYLEAVQTQMDRVTALLQEVLDQPGSTRERLGRFVQAILERVRQRPYGMRLLMTAEHRVEGDTTPEVDLLSLHMENLKMLTRLMDEGVKRGELRSNLSSRDLSMAFIGMVNLRALCCLHELPQGPDVPDILIDIFINGAGPSE